MNKYYIYMILFFIVIFKNNILSLINDIDKLFINNDDILLLKYEKEIDLLKKEIKDITDFKKNIILNDNFTITNIYKNNYGLNKLLISGNNYELNNEVINENGVIGIVSNINKNYSEVTYIYDTNIPVKINNNYGKIIGKDIKNNLIISELANIEININDTVYSINDNYIGKVIEINNNDLNKRVIVKTIDLTNLNYCIVVSERKI